MVAVVLATGRRDPAGDRLAVLGGLGFAATLMLSYGLVLLAAVPLGVAVLRRAVRPIVVAAATAGGALVVLAATGFWWLEGLGVARREYLESVARVRPYDYFLLADLALLVVIVGPATVVALVRLRDRRLWGLVGGALIAVAIADLSGMSKGEVERIWLPFAVWLAPACAALAGSGARRWLALQAGAALAVEVAVRTHW